MQNVHVILAIPSTHSQTHCTRASHAANYGPTICTPLLQSSEVTTSANLGAAHETVLQPPANAT